MNENYTFSCSFPWPRGPRLAVLSNPMVIVRAMGLVLDPLTAFYICPTSLNSRKGIRNVGIP